jgi:hypothetical protein
MAFKLDGRRFATRAGGIARIEYDASRPLRDRIVGVDSETSRGIKASLARWYGDLETPGENRLIAALSLFYPVAFTFSDLNGKPVLARRVTSVRVRSAHGVVRLFEGKALLSPQWLQGSRVVSTPTGPVEKEILYSVERVIVDGANVVNRAQQNFYPRRQREFPITLLFYSARFSARDALFGFPVGSGVRLRHPDGRWTYHHFGSSAEVVVGGLARGEYWVEVDGPGLSFLRPVTLTRDQETKLEVLSYLDVVLTLGILGLTALGLLYIGRPHLFAFLQPRRVRSLLARPGGGER